MKLIFITGNKDKFEEARSVLPDVEQFDLDLKEIQSLDSTKVIEAKLDEAKDKINGNIFVEDNSLVLDAINGLPGPLIKWFWNSIGNDGLYKIAESFSDFNATSKVTVGLIEESGKKSFFEGEIKGKIVPPKGDNGFGWDPIFQPEGSDKTFGEMTLEEKNEFSMRKIALQKLKNYLDNS